MKSPTRRPAALRDTILSYIIDHDRHNMLSLKIQVTGSSRELVHPSFTSQRQALRPLFNSTGATFHFSFSPHIADIQTVITVVSLI